MVTIRVLRPDDAIAFQTVRLRALKEHPEAFGSSYEEEVNRPQEEIAQRLIESSENALFGAFVNETLVGTLNINRNFRMKTRHRANLGAMYVAPEARGQGAGRSLIDAAIGRAYTMDGMEDVVLAVTVGNEAARHLYIQAGFKSYSIDPRYIRVGEDYFDIEWMILRLQRHG